MKMTGSMRLIVITFLILAALAYLLLLEFAINAGRVHHGVSVEGFDVGGLNRTEAEEALDTRGEEMKVSPMIFTTEGFDCRFTPAQVGWGPQEFETTNAAMSVGRGGSWTEALGDRLRAWTDGVQVKWSDSPDAAKVGRELNRCEEQAAGLGLEIDRARLRYEIRRAIVTWPRIPVPIPLVP
jgi:hypothetical protein